MALKSEGHENVIDSLTSSSPLLSEAAGLLAQTSLPVVGLPTTDPNRDKVSVAGIRTEGVSLADLVTRQAAVVSQAAPDLALAAPDYAVAATS